MSRFLTTSKGQVRSAPSFAVSKMVSQPSSIMCSMPTQQRENEASQSNEVSRIELPQQQQKAYDQNDKNVNDGEQVEGVGMDYTRIPKALDQAFEQLDEDAALQPTIISPGDVWTRRTRKGLLDAPVTSNLAAEELRRAKASAFDLLDALSKSGGLTLEDAELHVVVAATHAFDRTLVDTLVQGSVNPIEKVERSALIMATVVHGVTVSQLVSDGHRDRVTAYSPRLMLE
jgi:hypothetical protein